MRDDHGRIRCLVTGATGYIGGRLVPELLDTGFDVRCMSRSPQRLRDYPWVSRVERVEADATDWVRFGRRSTVSMWPITSFMP